jgi:hypothetical protein
VKPSPPKREKTLDFMQTMKQLMDIQATDSGLDELEKLKKNFLQEIGAFDSNLSNLKEKLRNQNYEVSWTAKRGQEQRTIPGFETRNRKKQGRERQRRGKSAGISF